MSDLMHEIYSLLDVLNKFMLPGSLEDCFQAYREELIKRVGESFNTNLQSWFLREISVLRGGEEFTSVVQACDPFLHLPSGCDSLPPGTQIAVPPLPTMIVDSTPDPAGNLKRLTRQEFELLRSRLQMYTDDEIDNFGKLALAGYVAPDIILPTPESVVSFIAINAGAKLEQYLINNLHLWKAVPRRQIHFPDMVAVRRKQLEETFAANNREALRPEELACYTDEELALMGRDVRILTLLPNRHLSICRWCLNRMISRQAVVDHFDRIGTEGTMGPVN